MTTSNSPASLAGVQLGVKNSTLGTDARLGEFPSQVADIISSSSETQEVKVGEYVYVTRTDGSKSIINVVEISYPQSGEGKIALNGIMQNGETLERLCEENSLQKFPSIGEYITININGKIIQKKIIDIRPNFTLLMGDFGNDSMEVPISEVTPLPQVEIGDEILIPRSNGPMSLTKVKWVNYNTGRLLAIWEEDGRQAEKEMDIGTTKKTN